jgi:MucR family transcriptional regulator, transcriptional regulator of exopolysaccharide biosynthesis
MEAQTGAAEAVDLKAHVAEIVSSHVSRNQIAPADLAAVITSVYEALRSLGKPAEPEPILTPAVPIRQSVSRDHVVCLECGHRAKTLARHLSAIHRLNPREYRVRWSLPPDHLSVAPGYSQERSDFAKRWGLGRRRNKSAEENPEAPSA